MKLLNLSLCSLILLIGACRSPHNRLENDVIWADTISNRVTNQMGHDGKLALRYLDSSFATKKHISEQALWRKYQAKVNYYQYYEHDFIKWRILIDSMIMIAERKKEEFSYEYANSLFAMATLLQEEKKYNEAFQYYYDGRNFAAGKLDRCSMSSFSNALGVIRFRQKQYKQAIPYFYQAYSDIAACKNASFRDDFIQPQSILNSIALCFERSEDLDSAIHYYKKAISFIRLQEKRYPGNRGFIYSAKAVVEGNLGGVYAKQGDISSAENYLLANIAYNDRPGYEIEDAQTAKIKLANVYIQSARLKKAEKLIDQVGADLNSGRGKSAYYFDVLSRWYLLKSNFYEKKGDIKNAFLFSKKFHALSDSLDAAQQSFRDINVDEVLQGYDQRIHLDLLKRKSELKTAYLTSLFILLVATIFAAVMSLNGWVS